MNELKPVRQSTSKKKKKKKKKMSKQPIVKDAGPMRTGKQETRKTKMVKILYVPDTLEKCVLFLVFVRD